jgi:D-tyrosyl-tRNA(Tyr) deacylase
VKTVIQRVRNASVKVDGEVVGAIERGLLVFIGVGHDDTDAEARWLANKISVLRIFEDDDGKFNRSLLDTGGSVLVVSQFTLYGDAQSQRRPSFIKAAPPSIAAPLIERFVMYLTNAGVPHVATGRFGARMQVELVNDGPVTILLDSAGK